MDAKKSEATRYLCAAAYVDTAFRRKALDDLVHNKYRTVGPSFGVDLQSVLAHCQAADSRKLKQNAVLLVLSALLIWAYSSLNVVFGLFLIAIIWLVVFLEEHERLTQIIGGQLARHSFSSQEVLWTEQSPAARRSAIRIKTTRVKILETQTPISPRITFLSSLTTPGQALAPAELCVYSGYSPFVGAGVAVGGWSFSINISRGGEENGQRQSPKSFFVRELYNSVSQSIHSLQLPETEIANVICVHGQDIHGDPLFLTEPLKPPKLSIDTDSFTALLEKPSQQARCYQRIQAIDWSGDIVFSTFLRYHKLETHLFVEASFFLLPPIRQSLRATVDSRHSNPSLSELLAMATSSLFRAPFLCLLSGPELLLRSLKPLDLFLHGSADRRRILETKDFDYGAPQSLREFVSATSYRRYFQKVDKDLYLKTIERTILDTLITFLRERHIDTSDLKERQTTIQNSGVIVTGGSLTAEALSVGEQAQTVVRKIADAGRRHFGSRTGTENG